MSGRSSTVYVHGPDNTADERDKLNNHVPNTTIYETRVHTLMETFHDDLPIGLTKDILSFTPRVLQKVLEIEKKREEFVFVGSPSSGNNLVRANISPSVSSLYCSLMLADVSGFCKVSEELCAQGVEGLDELRTGINSCFSDLINTITRYGGDILNFAGDALIIAWFDISPVSEVITAVNGNATNSSIGNICPIVLNSVIDEEPPTGHSVLKHLELRRKLNALACTKCGLCLAASEPLFGRAKLKLHIGVASGNLSLFVAGGIRSEYQFLALGSTYQELGAAATLAMAKQLVITQDTYSLLEGLLTTTNTEPNGDTSAHIVNTVDEDMVKQLLTEADNQTEKFRSEYTIPYSNVVSTRALMFIPPPPELDVLSPTPYVAVEPEIREVTVIFLKFDGPRINAALEQEGTGNLGLIEDIVRIAQEGIHNHDAMLRQFLVDDKGMVMIIALGVPHCVHIDDPARGLKCAHQVCYNLAGLGIHTFAGVTTGKAYIGSVGNNSRREYALVGDSVNLAARLMAFGWKKSLKDEQQNQLLATPDAKGDTTKKKTKRTFIACDARTQAATESQGFGFVKHENVPIKGKTAQTIFEVTVEEESNLTGLRLDYRKYICIGFEEEMKHLKSLVKGKELRRRVSMLAFQAGCTNAPFGAEIFGCADQTGTDSEEEEEKEGIGEFKPRRKTGPADVEKLPLHRAHSIIISSPHGSSSRGGALLSSSLLLADPKHRESDKEEEENEENSSSDEDEESAKPFVPCNRRRAGVSDSATSVDTPQTSSYSRRKSSARLSIFRKAGGTILVIRSDQGGGKSTFLQQACKTVKGAGLIPVLVKLKPADHYSPYATLSLIFQNLLTHPDVVLIGNKRTGAFVDVVMKQWEESLNPEELAALPMVKGSILKMSQWNIAGFNPSHLHGQNTESQDLIQTILLKLFTSPTFMLLNNEKVVLALDDIQFMDSCSWEVLIRIVTAPEISLLMFCTSLTPSKTFRKVPGPGSDGPGVEPSLSRVDSNLSTENGQKTQDLHIHFHQLSEACGELQTITLSRLTLADVSVLVKSMFPDSNWDEREIRTIHDLSDGHPFVALELARSIDNSHGGDISKKLSGTSDRAEAIAKAYTARIDSRTNAEQKCLKAASVIGVEFEYTTLVEIVPRSFLRLQGSGKVTQLEQVLASLVEADFFRVASTTPRNPDKTANTKHKCIMYEFTHPQLQAVCYSLLLKADQILYHKQIAGWISAKYQDDLREFSVPLMFHTLKANEYDKAMDFAIGAIKTSIVSGAFSECKVIISQSLYYVEKGKMKSRTVRMMRNTMQHLLDQHQDFQDVVMKSQVLSPLKETSDSPVKRFPNQNRTYYLWKGTRKIQVTSLKCVLIFQAPTV